MSNRSVTENRFIASCEDSVRLNRFCGQITDNAAISTSEMFLRAHSCSRSKNCCQLNTELIESLQINGVWRVVWTKRGLRVSIWKRVAHFRIFQFINEQVARFLYAHRKRVASVRLGSLRDGIQVVQILNGFVLLREMVRMRLSSIANKITDQETGRQRQNNTEHDRDC